MIFRGKNIKDFTESDLTEMVREEETESLEIEFKSQMYGANHEGKKEMLKDISAMANAYGGLILIGINEKDHCASSVVAISNGIDHQSTILKSCRSSLDQLIDGLEVHPIPVEKGLHVLAVVIPDSHNKPHAVDFQGHFRCYRRVGTDNLPMSMQEVREMILLDTSLREKSDEFFYARRKQLCDKYGDAPNLVVSFLPKVLQEPGLHFSREDLYRIFDPNPSRQLDLVSNDKPEVTVDSMRASLCRYGEDGVTIPLLTSQVFENGYVEMFVHYPTALARSDAYHPQLILGWLVRCAGLAKRACTRFRIHSPFRVRLWTTSTDHFMLSEQLEHERNWGPHEYKEEIFLVSSDVTSMSQDEDVLVLQVFEKLYHAFHKTDCRYYKDGRVEKECWKYL